MMKLPVLLTRLSDTDFIQKLLLLDQFMCVFSF